MVNCYAGLSERKFRKWAQMDANTPLCHSERLLCHSEHSEESRPGKGKRFFAYALNDKRPNANFANGRKWMQIPPFVIPNASFVIPNTVRNLAPEKERDSSLTL